MADESVVRIVLQDSTQGASSSAAQSSTSNLGQTSYAKIDFNQITQGLTKLTTDITQGLKRYLEPIDLELQDIKEVLSKSLDVQTKYYKQEQGLSTRSRSGGDPSSHEIERILDFASLIESNTNEIEKSTDKLLNFASLIESNTDSTQNHCLGIFGKLVDINKGIGDINQTLISTKLAHSMRLVSLEEAITGKTDNINGGSSTRNEENISRPPVENGQLTLITNKLYEITDKFLPKIIELMTMDRQVSDESHFSNRSDLDIDIFGEKVETIDILDSALQQAEEFKDALEDVTDNTKEFADYARDIYAENAGLVEPVIDLLNEVGKEVAGHLEYKPEIEVPTSKTGIPSAPKTGLAWGAATSTKVYQDLIEAKIIDPNEVTRTQVRKEHIEELERRKNPEHHARGGVAGQQRGSSGTDTVPAWLTPGEVVVPKSMVDGGAIDHLKGEIPGFAGGGFVSAAYDMAKSAINIGTTASSDAAGSVGQLGDAISSVGSKLTAAVPVVGGFVEGIGMATKAFSGLMSAINETANRYAEYSPEISQAQSIAEIRQITGDFRRAQEASSQLSEYLIAQSDLQQKFEDIKIKFLVSITPIVTRIVEILEAIMPAGESISGSVSALASPLEALASFVGDMVGMHRDDRMPKVEDPTTQLLNTAGSPTNPMATFMNAEGGAGDWTPSR